MMSKLCSLDPWGSMKDSQHSAYSLMISSIKVIFFFIKSLNPRAVCPKVAIPHKYQRRHFMCMFYILLLASDDLLGKLSYSISHILNCVAACHLPH